MAITQEKNIEMLEKLPDGNFKIKYPKTKAENIIDLARYAATTGSANTYVASIPGISNLVAGLRVTVKINVVNTGASTLNVNGLGAKSIRKSSGVTLTSGNLKATGVYTLVYDGTNFILQGEGGEYGTAAPADVLAGKTIGTDEGIKTGTMPVNPSQTSTIQITGSGKPTKAVPAGYTPGGTITAELAAALASKILQGNTIGGVAGTAPAVGQGEQEFISSTTWVVPFTGTVDAFCVGGGGGGGGGGVYGGTTYNGGAGGQSNIKRGSTTLASANGGNGGGNGGTLSSGTAVGGNGGSGGGCGGAITPNGPGRGGENGADGAVNAAGTGTSGTGQHTTTRRWGLADGTLYAYGGNGMMGNEQASTISDPPVTPGNGGRGGRADPSRWGGSGGGGGYTVTALHIPVTAGDALTVSVGAGGKGGQVFDVNSTALDGHDGLSGIVVIRWGY